MRRPGLWVANGIPSDPAMMYSWRPGAITCFYDYLGLNHVTEYKRLHPSVQVTVRFQHPKDWRNDLSGSASRLAAEVASKWPSLEELNPYVYFANEMNLHYENGDNNPANQPLYETQNFYEAYAEWVRQVADGIKQRVPEMRLVTPPFAFGHHEDGAPDDDGNPKDEWAGYDYMADYIPTYFSSILTGHYYWGDAGGSHREWLYGPESSWYAFRWERVLKLFEKRYGIIAEMIIDEAGNMAASDIDFTEQIIYHAEKCLRDPRIIGVTYFLWEDPTYSDGNMPNSWWHKCVNIHNHVQILSKFEDVTEEPHSPHIRVLRLDGEIEELSLEEYLRGVVPSELGALQLRMPLDATHLDVWGDDPYEIQTTEMEALKFQAVISRSYALWRMANPRDADYDIVATAMDQVYNPDRIHPRSDEAIDATRGMYLQTATGAPYMAQYINACGLEHCSFCRGGGGYQSHSWPGRGCQFGAQCQARGGANWREIVGTYYDDAVIVIGGEIPPEGEDVSFKIYDVLGNEKDAAWLASTWGAVVSESLRREGEANFELVELQEKEGPSEFVVTVLDRNGAPWSGRYAMRYYPSAPNSWPNGSVPADIPCPSYARAHMVYGPTDKSGIVGFGVGTGDYAGPGEGVTSIWIGEHYAGTDVVEKLGMMPNTNHRLLCPTFRYVPAEGEEPPPTPEAPGCIGWLINVLKAIGGIS